MNINESKKRYIYQSIILCTILVLLSVFYYISITSPTYIGVSTRKIEDKWQVSAVHRGGSAEKVGVSKGDIILAVNGNSPDENPIVKRWLIVEQAQSISIERRGKMMFFEFSKNDLNTTKYWQLITVVIILFIFLFWYSTRQIISKRSIYFYYFLCSVTVGLLSIVPSSVGNPVGRFFVILMISILPIFISSFSFKIYDVKELTKINKVPLVFAIINMTILVTNIFFDIPLSLVVYLSKGVFFVLFFLLLLVFLESAIHKKNKNTKFNLWVVSTLCVLPLFIFYVLELGWSAPFSIVIPFLLFPVAALFHRLTISKSFLFRYKVSEKVLYLIIATIYTSIILLFIILSNYVPLYILGFYGFFLIYSLLPVFSEMVSVIRKNKSSNDYLTSFIIAEEERESISLYIHDTIIQDIIYFIKELKEEETVSSDETREVMEETVYLLRELCSDVYPLMIQELGLKSSLTSIINQNQKKYPVKITMEMKISQAYLSEKISNFILRSLKELMNNSILHGKAKQIILLIWENNDCYFFSVKDDGNFHVDDKKKERENHFGLDVIKEKLKLLDGKMVVDLKKGTTITLSIPKQVTQKNL